MNNITNNGPNIPDHQSSLDQQPITKKQKTAEPEIIIDDGNDTDKRIVKTNEIGLISNILRQRFVGAIESESKALPQTILVIKKKSDIELTKKKMKCQIQNVFSAIKENYNVTSANTIEKILEDFADQSVLFAYYCLSNCSSEMTYQEYIASADETYASTILKSIQEELKGAALELKKMRISGKLNDGQLNQKLNALLDIALRLEARIIVARDFNGILDFHNSAHSFTVGRMSAKLMQNVKADNPYADQTMGALGDWHDAVMTWKAITDGKVMRDPGTGAHNSEGASVVLYQEALSKYCTDIQLATKIVFQCGDDEILRRQKIIEATIPRPEFGPGKAGTVSNDGELVKPTYVLVTTTQQDSGFLDRQTADMTLTPLQMQARVESHTQKYRTDPHLKSTLATLLQKVVAWADLSESQQIDFKTMWSRNNSIGMALEDYLKVITPFVDTFRRPSSVADIMTFIESFCNFIKGQSSFATARAVVSEERILFPLKALSRRLKEMQQAMTPLPDGWTREELTIQASMVKQLISNFESCYCQPRAQSEDEESILPIRRGAAQAVLAYYQEEILPIITVNMDELLLLWNAIKDSPDLRNALLEAAISNGTSLSLNDLKDIEATIKAKIPVAASVQAQIDALNVLTNIAQRISAKLDNHLLEERAKRILPKQVSAQPIAYASAKLYRSYIEDYQSFNYVQNKQQRMQKHSDSERKIHAAILLDAGI